MKKGIFLAIIVFVLMLLCSCSNENKSSEKEQDNIASSNEEVMDKTEENNKDEQDPPVKSDSAQDSVEESNHLVQKEPLYIINDVWFLEPIKEGTNEKVVLLTIDDAPDDHALEMAKTLSELEAPAIFFVNGHFLETEKKKNTLKQIHEMGFAIGNHTFNHQNLTEVDEEIQREEILSLNALINEIIGEKPQFFRAPNGANTDFVKNLVEKEGMLLMNWSYGYDWVSEYQSKQAITEIMLNAPELRNGANLLMHDRPWTAEALADIVKGLRDKGYKIADPATIKTP